MRAEEKRNLVNLVGGLLVVFLSLFASILAQGTGTVQGHISDETGGAIPGVTIKATNQETGVSRSVLSAEDGYYRIPDLLPGSYRIQLEFPGFKTALKNGVRVTAEAVVGENFVLQVGEVTDSVNVSAEEPLVETQVARISEVIREKELSALPVQGRGVLTLTAISPGIQGKVEARGKFCCDVFSNFAAPVISSGGNEIKANFTMDGVNLRYTSNSLWGALMSPNPDAVAEVRVSAHPHSAEFGTISGPQVQIFTKGGTNNWHGTAHYTTQEDELNARPYFSSRVQNSYSRLFGGTLGGPIRKDRLFIFGAFEGLREQEARTSVQVVETKEFSDFVVQTRPKTIAALLLKSFPPFQYPTSKLVDVGSPAKGVFEWSKTPDGIPDLGQVTLDRPVWRRGKQFNTRVDYHSPSGRDRIFGSFWYTRPDYQDPALRDDFQRILYTRNNTANGVYTRSFSSSTLNEVRIGIWNFIYEAKHSGAYHIPTIISDDGFRTGNFSHSREYNLVKTVEFGNIFSINWGKHGMKVGGHYRRPTLEARTLRPGNTPEYSFASILDFADDEPYQEFRVLKVGTGEAYTDDSVAVVRELAFFVHNTWQIRPNFTLNYGLRWENRFSNWLTYPEENWQPVLTSAQVSPSQISELVSQRVDRYYDSDLNNFGPRLGIAWDPSSQGKMSVRGGFAVLYDEISGRTFASTLRNPPTAADVVAGVQLGVPITYGLAPQGTRDFPSNPNLKVPKLDARGGIGGTRVTVGALVKDLQVPLVLDMFGGIQYRLLSDLMVQFDYKYRRNTNDIYAVDVNRFQGDLVDGRLNRLNPSFSRINLHTNLGRRIYHGLITALSKRFSQGWSLNASYTYNYGKNNFGTVLDFDYAAGATDAFHSNLDWARDDIPHIFTVHSVWEVPTLRGQSGWLAGALGGWQLNTIWNLQSGGLFVPFTGRLFGRGGDFNADGQRSDRPDRPTVTVKSTYSKDEWVKGPLKASIFALPDSSNPRPGNMPRDLFRFPGYARIDAALVKTFPAPIGRAERGQLQIRAEAFNLLNRLNISAIESALERSNFGFPTAAYQNRRIQIGVRLVF